MRDALELSGTPFLYFPEMMPQARGDQVMAPTPVEKNSGEWDDQQSRLSGMAITAPGVSRIPDSWGWELSAFSMKQLFPLLLQ